MVRKPTAKRLTRLFKRLDDDDREQVIQHAERLADSDTSKSPESLVEGDTRPSYMAAVDEDAYEQKKARKEHREQVYGRG